MNKPGTPDCLPCPFCGHDAASLKTKSSLGTLVRCGNCGASTEFYVTTDGARLAWNTRALTPSESGQGTPEGRGSSLAGALADGSPLGSTPEAKAGSAVPAGAAGTPRWREKDPDSGDDLIELWKKRPRHSDEYAAAEIIEQLERELADALKEIAKSEEKQLKAMEFGAQSVRSATEDVVPLLCRIRDDLLQRAKMRGDDEPEVVDLSSGIWKDILAAIDSYANSKEKP